MLPTAQSQQQEEFSLDSGKTDRPTSPGYGWFGDPYRPTELAARRLAKPPFPNFQLPRETEGDSEGVLLSLPLSVRIMPKVSRNSAQHKTTLPQSTFVLDNGADTLKAGFAPGDLSSDTETCQNCHVIPNALVRTRDKRTYIASQVDQLTQWNEAIFRRPVERGQLVNWPAQQEIWEHSIFDEKTAKRELLIKNPEDTTLILTEAPNTMPALQKNTDEIVMEEWGFGGYARVQSSSLNSYNDLHPLFGNAGAPESPRGRLLPLECLLLIDSGYSHTVITPLYNGVPLQRAIRRINIGGKHFTNLLKELISIRHFDVHQDFKVVNDIKEDISFVSQDFKEDMEKTWKGNKGRRRPQTSQKHGPNGDQMDIDHPASSESLSVDYILPDGIHLLRGFSRPHNPATINVKKRKLHTLSAPSPTNELSMTLSSERFTVPEILFTPSDIGSSQPGLADCVMQSLSVLPPLVQATMLANTLVVGGNARIRGFVERLQAELREQVKTEWIVRVRRMEDPVTSTWLGGARLASGNRPVVKEWAVSREEYLEHGSGWVSRKFVGAGLGG